MIDDDYKRGRLDVVKAVIGGLVVGGVGLLQDEGMQFDEAVDYLSETLEKARSMRPAMAKMRTATEEIVADAKNEAFIAEHLRPKKQES